MNAAFLLRRILFRLALLFPGVFCLGLAVVQPAMSTSEAPRAWIETVVADQSLRVLPMLVLAETKTVRYEFTATRSGAAGNSTSRQAGSRRVECCEPVVLARLALSFGDGDRYTLALRVFEGDTLLYEDRVTYPSPG